MDLSPARSSAISIASSYVGVTGDAYEQIVAAPELAAGLTERAREMGAMSGCGLLYLALAAAAFGAPFGLYPTGQAFELIYALAGGSPWKPGGALRAPTFSSHPALGDALIWGENGPHPAHVDACVEAIEEPDPYSASSPPTLALTVIAGGQRVTREDVAAGRGREEDIGHETVKRLERVLRWDGRAWVDRDNGRRLLAVIDADMMAERYAYPP